MSEILFNSYLKGAYSESLSKMDGLQGLIINQRTSLDVMTNFFNPESECFSKAGAQRRERFYENWDIIIEYWFNNSDYFFSSRFNKNLISFTQKFEEKYLKSDKNPPKVEIVFFDNDINLKNITCYSNEENKWKKTEIKFLSNNHLSLILVGKFITERGRINCSLREETGEWRWLGIQFVIAEK